MEIKADVLQKTGKVDEARRVLESALPVAREIGPQQVRENNMRKITAALSELKGREYARP